MAADADQSFALLADGSVLAWGRNLSGQLGFDTWTPEPVVHPE